MAKLFQTIDEKATKLLRQSDALTTPVDLDRVVRHLKLSVNENPLENEYSGFLAVKEKTIVVNSNHPPARRRFTIAHEIGHYQLHRREKADTQVFIDRTVYFRNENSSGVEYRLELEANAFAAGLLMPEVLLDEYLGKHPRLDLEKSIDIKTLADEFEVSRQAMEYRLKNLGFILHTSF
ncbi:MAG: ImmA/IrrE family metallo-endopeptidase [Gammaproteobacteria bacterium]|nr:ImmA/IrrE family metallo-endopeptidase [Gammaproteobacteria bacterium]MCY4281886.1 ImmA/IrrE family metallo-endopeptidase [Gammaproteobacteria bacterium]